MKITNEKIKKICYIEDFENINQLTTSDIQGRVTAIRKKYYPELNINKKRDRDKIREIEENLLNYIYNSI